ncbi:MULTISPECIES: DUF4124 domain-containing protein [Methylotenera]|uniref:DUF4124 domain-containing protein n=1 Tax=Methylotenera TaxID=359407 RepID=UPI00036EC146|nr:MULTISPECIES: DUF4124 domain-containing protein [Methylotenera]
MRFDHLIVVLAVFIALPSLSYAELYKWKDKNGQMQYTDTPPPSNIKLENLKGKKNLSPTGKEPLSTVTNPQAVPAAAPRTFIEPPTSTANPEDAAAKIRQQNAEAEKKNKQEKESQAKLKAENCKAAKANYESYAQGGRIYKMNEKGEREYMDDAGLEQGANKARGEMAKYCN